MLRHFPSGMFHAFKSQSSILEKLHFPTCMTYWSYRHLQPVHPGMMQSVLAKWTILSTLNCLSHNLVTWTWAVQTTPSATATKAVMCKYKQILTNLCNRMAFMQVTDMAELCPGCQSGWRLPADPKHQPSPASFLPQSCLQFSFWAAFHESSSWPIWWSRLANELQGPSCLCLPSNEVTAVGCAQSFTHNVEIKL